MQAGTANVQELLGLYGGSRAVQLSAQRGGAVWCAYIDDMFALVPFLIVGTRAGRQLANVHTVDVACTAGKVDCLFGSFLSSASGAIDNKHPLHSCQDRTYGQALSFPYLCVSARYSLSR